MADLTKAGRWKSSRIPYFAESKAINMIARADLQYTYSWTHFGSDNPKVSGAPDHTELNRSEGYEMLYFINKCAEQWGWAQTEKAACLRLEVIIKTKVPSSTRTQRGIKEWIQTNYPTV